MFHDKFSSNFSFLTSYIDFWFVWLMLVVEFILPFPANCKIVSVLFVIRTYCVWKQYKIYAEYMIETNQFHIQANWKKYFDISMIH